MLIFISWKVLITFALPLCPADRHSAATPEVQKEEEKKFKEVGEAFTVLSDPKKKVRYDNGHDLDDDCGFDGRGMCCLSQLSLHKPAGHVWDCGEHICALTEVEQENDGRKLGELVFIESLSFLRSVVVNRLLVNEHDAEPFITHAYFVHC